MNILIDIGHPGHVHLFCNLIELLKEENNNVFVSTKDILIIKDLLERKSISFISLGQKFNSLPCKALNQIKYNYRIYQLVKKHNIRLGIGTSVTLAHVSQFTRMKSIILDDDDDEVQPLFVKTVHPFCDYLLSPDVLRNNRKRKDTIFYPSYHELAYLHPDLFQPDPTVLRLAGLSESEPFFVLRFNAFLAHHDRNVSGLNFIQKKELINLLSNYGKVIISAENEVEQEFRSYQIKIPVDKIHSLLYYAKLFCGDSQTMTTEAAVVGTPAIKCNSLAGKLSVHNELESRYDMCYSYLLDDFDSFIDKIRILAKQNNLKSIWDVKKEKLFKYKVNATNYLHKFINTVN